MDEQKRVERLAEAIDAIVLEGRAPDAEGDLASLLTLAADLQAAMPPVQASTAFQESLRSHLLAHYKPWWKRLLGGQRSWNGVQGSLSLPRYALAAAALALVLGAAVFLAQPSQDTSLPTQAQPTTAPAATAAALAVAALPPQSPDVSIPSTVRSGPTTPAVGIVLPPLSESSPVAVMVGLGGGGIGGPAGETPKREVHFELATSLPEFPPAATVYRYEAPSADVERLRRLASSLGFDPAALRPMADAPDAYVLSDPALGSLDSPGPGSPVSYRAAFVKEKASVESPVLPSAEGAVGIATRWLAEHGLHPDGAGVPSVSLPYPNATFEEVVLRPAEPANIVGDYPAVRVAVDAGGKVISATLFWPRVESTLTVPARTAESAWGLLSSDSARLLFDGEHGRPDFHGKVTITSAETAYTMTFGLDGRPYLQPVVLFKGESVMDGDPEHRPFTAEVPLAADSVIAREEVRYHFDGTLPSVPARAAVLERDAAPPPNAEQVRELGRKLGLSGEPRSLPGPSGSVPNWEMGDPNGHYMFRMPGDTSSSSWMETWSYSPLSYEPPSAAEVTSPLDAESAVRIATDFLRGHGLYAPDLAPGRVQPVALGASASTVLFPRVVDGLPVVEPPSIAVTLDPRGDVVSIISNQHPLRTVRGGSLLAPSEASAAVESGKGTIQVPSLPGRAIYSDHAQIEKVEIVYRLSAPEAGARPPLPGESPTMRYEPYYLFTGTIDVGESRKPLPFTTILPALKP